MADAVDVLVSAMNDSHAILQRIKQNVAAGRMTDGDLRAFGEWVDRAARISKLALDAGVQERQTRLSEAQGLMLAAVVKRILARLELPVERMLEANAIAAEELRAAPVLELEAGRS